MVDPRRPYFPGPSLGHGLIKQQPEDFVVTEQLGFEPSGRGEHLFFWIEKRGISTHDVAAELAELLNLPRRAIGYSGRKDKHALCYQWFSAHRPGIDRPRLLPQSHWQVLQVTRNARHLKVGTHQANDFDLWIREAEVDPDALHTRFEQLERDGVPNYFGRQRFGLDNLERALRGGQDEMALAAARSALFNRMLEQRVRSGEWLSMPAGEPWLRRTGNGWVMQPTPDQLVDPCLPLFGPTPGVDPQRQQAWQDEFKQHADLVAVLAQHSWQPHRRRSRLLPSHTQLEIHPQGIRIRARLPAGAFMTTVLDALLETHDAHTY